MGTVIMKQEIQMKRSKGKKYKITYHKKSSKPFSPYKNIYR